MELNMTSMTSNIVVAGDVFVDWFFWTKPSDQKNINVNWKLFNSLYIRPKIGGSLLISELIEKNLRKTIQDLNKTKKNLSKSKLNLSKVGKKLDISKDNLIFVQENLNIAEKNLIPLLETPTESSDITEIQENLCGTQHTLSTIPTSPEKIREGLNDTKKILLEVQEILSKIQDTLNTTPRTSRVIREGLNETKKFLVEIQENLSEAQNVLSTIPKLEEIMTEAQYILSTTTKIKEDLSEVKYIFSTTPKSPKKFQKRLSNTQKNIDKIKQYLNDARKALSKTQGTVEETEMYLNKIQEKLKNKPISMISQFSKDLDLYDPEEILHLNTELCLYPSWDPNSKVRVYRVKKYFGATIPQTDYPEPLSIINDNKGLEEFIIIYDVGNGFRFEENKWPQALTNKNNKPTVIYYMFPPLFDGGLWKYTRKNHNENLILILNIEDLRNLGANISRSLSWERTALELLWEINKNPKLNPIKYLRNVIIRFKEEGLIHYTGMDKNSHSKLYFDPSVVEDGFWDNEKYGKMRGSSIVFVSSLASELINDKYIEEKEVSAALEAGIKVGMLKSREFLKNGYGTEKDENNFYSYFFDDLIQINEEVDYIKCATLPPFYNKSTEPDPMFWSILKERTKTQEPHLVEVAMNIVQYGWSAIEDFPLGHFGDLTTVDRAEIESFGSLKNIMKRYINSEKKPYSENNLRPLSISVFGYPGSGKSFGITEVAKSIDQKRIFEVDFNVSQFRSIKDLISAFHRVRDISLKGKIPLVFFDEFDCTFEDRPLGWLKYFLAPMQDGEFMDCGTVHPIGKSIFVFAGGIYKSFQEFCENTSIASNTQAKLPEKCPDFISRLRGYVNILGPNRISENRIGGDKRDDAYIIRRAVQLRSLIERKAPNIMNEHKDNKGRSTKFAKIDKDLLKTLLIIPKYKHGVRSMEAIIDMSMLQGHNSWEKSSLPPRDQLELHIDGKCFFTILEEPDIYSESAVSYISILQ